MVEQKKPAKKAAAKKAEPVVEQAPEYTGPAFPLPQDHYFHPPVTSPRAHDGSDATSNAALRLLQRSLGLSETGRYDDATAARVVDWKGQHGLDRSPVIDAQTWQALHTGEE